MLEHKYVDINDKDMNLKIKKIITMRSRYDKLRFAEFTKFYLDQVNDAIADINKFQTLCRLNHDIMKKTGKSRYNQKDCQYNKKCAQYC